MGVCFGDTLEGHIKMMWGRGGLRPPPHPKIDNRAGQNDLWADPRPDRRARKAEQAGTGSFPIPGKNIPLELRI